MIWLCILDRLSKKSLLVCCEKDFRGRLPRLQDSSPKCNHALTGNGRWEFTRLRSRDAGRRGILQDDLRSHEQVLNNHQLGEQGRELSLCLFLKGLRSPVLKGVRWTNAMGNAS
jgi:hypothetical protein